MRASAVTGEAWRNLLSGTTKAALFATVFVATVGVVATLDVRSVVGVLQSAEEFAASGAAVQVIKADAQIDGRRCDTLAGTGAIAAAGALRQGAPVRLWAMPGAPIQTIEATPGLIALLPLIGQPALAGALPSDGVWLSADLAQTLGASPGSTIDTDTGRATVAGVYTWPDDGRARDLGYVMVIPVPTDGTFSQCWARIWPPDDDLSGLLFTTVNGATSGNQVSLGQLNTSLGATFDARAMLNGRLTRQAPWAGILIGLALGYVAARSRRLELASALHARVPRPQLTLQHLIETGAWAAAGAVIAAAGLLWAARLGNPDPSWTTWLIGVRTVAAGAATTLLGTLIGVTTSREKHLFRYTKDR